MNKNVIIFILMLIPSIVGFYAGYEFKSHGKPTNTQADTVIVTDSTLKLKYDSALQVINTQGPDTFWKIAPPVNYPTQKVDTAFILQNYNTWYVYTDSVRNKDLALSIIDTVTANKIIGRKLSYKILRPDSIITIETTKTITKEVARGTNNLFVGTQVGVNGSNMLLAPHVLYTTKNKLAFSLGYELYQHTPTIGIYYKIK